MPERAYQISSGVLLIARPGRAIGLLWVGAAALAIGLISAGVGLIAGTPS
jgi:hypothetical protein